MGIVRTIGRGFSRVGKGLTNPEPKKMGQWIGAVAALVVMVFVITLAVNYLGRGETTKNVPPPPPDYPALDFPVTDYPGDETAMEVEMRTPGFHDFWFSNEEDKPVPFGVLNRTRCTCSSIQAFLLPPGVTSPEKKKRDDKAALDLEAKVEPIELTDDNEVNVPSGGVGWVRLKWNGTKRIDRVGAELWMADKAKGGTKKLSVAVLFVEPIQVDHLEKNVGTVTPDSPPGHAEIVVFSTIRQSFTFKVEVVGSRGPQDSEPFEIGKPVPVSAEEIKKIESKYQAGSGGGHVKAAYRVPITVREHSEDKKKLFDLGPFRRTVRISSEDQGTEPADVHVSGTIEGEVTVGQAEDNGRIDLGTFRADRPHRLGKPLVLQTEHEGIDLAVDQAPEFMQVKLVLEKGGSGRKSWLLNVEVPARQAEGSFPRDEAGYRDTAIYLKLIKAGDAPRRIRIPVSGAASK
jgi:hypothetical protein